MQLDSKKHESSATKIMYWILGVATLLLIAVFVAYTNKFLGGKSASQEVWGQFGDYFGGTLNPLLSFLALIALLFTFRLQAKELGQSTEAITEQAKTLKIQQFENTFFNLIRLHNQIVDEMFSPVTEHQQSQAGRACFINYYSELERKYQEERSISILDRPVTPDEPKFIESAYEKFFVIRQPKVGHYFRNLYTIVRFIKESCPSNNRLYIRILRAQLSSYELGLLFYNSLHSIGKERFKPLIEELSLFENMDFDLIFDKSHIELYAKTAYESPKDTTVKN